MHLLKNLCIFNALLMGLGHTLSTGSMQWQNDSAHAGGFQHPGALHTAADIARVKQRVAAGDQPWARAYAHLANNTLAQTTWVPKPHAVLTRGSNATFSPNQTYADAYRDAHAAYQLTWRYLVTGNTSFADHAALILDSWSSTLQTINGTEDLYLAAGLYGYQFANAAELLRVYPGWPQANQTAFGNMLNDIFAVFNRDFLLNHNNKQNFYYANWDLCNIASLLSIGIYNDNQTMFDYAVDYFKNGLPGGVVANGALPFYSIANFTEEGSDKILMQGQESGRDQGHAGLSTVLTGVVAQLGFNQGVDLFDVFGREVLHGAEYFSKYNVGYDVPYTSYISWEGNLSVVAEKQRYAVRPGMELIHSHYAELKGLNASWSQEFRDYVNRNITANVEGGGGDFGPNSGGFDAFGHGTLLYRLTPES
ncbi:hypothetical protein PFICI_04734 [Pestalotiopsis fici W106-1]|uniref:Alginate lyase domain-containing protein n=1 Tax=Pestalotiopsis fici (strain W106-1 / CGMCC3.15140) TaxID=1229662 RepID=W3X9S0_PESFW|nr:uncharacterized protein PFICI_04734 [Pestalotiopsis fici W106-1]ETS82858.1 hypothetical protein PFICI_04734 [Pestalotiopsis fici W106-1]